MAKYAILIVMLGLVLAAIALIASVSTIKGFLRRRRGEDHDGEVIADSEVEFETDVGKPPF